MLTAAYRPVASTGPPNTFISPKASTPHGTGWAGCHPHPASGPPGATTACEAVRLQFLLPLTAPLATRGPRVTVPASRRRRGTAENPDQRHPGVRQLEPATTPTLDNPDARQPASRAEPTPRITPTPKRIGSVGLSR